MKMKNYFNNLEKYWSANFLALIASVFFVSFILWILVHFVDLSFNVGSFSEYIELLKNSLSYGIGYSIIFFPLSCCISAFVSIFYIFIIISRKKWCVVISLLTILIFLSKFIIENKDIMESTGFGDVVFFYLLPMSIIGILISIGIYLILLLLELIPKFRVPQSPVSQNSIFKKYIRIFYRCYFIIIFLILYILIELIFLN